MSVTDVRGGKNEEKKINEKKIQNHIIVIIFFFLLFFSLFVRICLYLCLYIAKKELFGKYSIISTIFTISCVPFIHSFIHSFIHLRTIHDKVVAVENSSGEEIILSSVVQFHTCHQSTFPF